MNTFSHRMFGKLLLQYLREQHGVRLDRDAFLHGNILPDFRRAYKYKPHMPVHWARFLQREIGALSRSRQEGACFDASFSRRLGIICHFYADFFCHAHTDRFEGGAYEHIRYEWLLNRRLRARMPILKAADPGAAVPEGRDTARIFEGFRSLQRDYLANAPSYDNDIAFTLRACLGVLAAVTRNAAALSEEDGGRLMPVPAGADTLVSAI